MQNQAERWHSPIPSAVSPRERTESSWQQCRQLLCRDSAGRAALRADLPLTGPFDLQLDFSGLSFAARLRDCPLGSGGEEETDLES